MKIHLCGKEMIKEGILGQMFYRASIGYHEPLYHYTGKAGLEGIMKSHQLWATEYRHLNDKNEFKLIEGIIPEVLKQFKLNKSFVQLFSDSLIQEIRRLNNARSVSDSFFVACFSLNSDNLLLWSEFANDGCNLRIMEFDDLQEYICRNDFFVFPGLVIYDKNEQYEIIESCLTSVVNEKIPAGEILQVLQESPDWSLIHEYIQEVALLIRYYSMYMKGEIYKGEEEYRIVFQIKNHKDIKVKYRSKAGYQKRIPYVAVDFIDQYIPFDGITLSPKFHSQSDEDAYESILKKGGYDYSFIERAKSAASLRY